MTLRSPTAAPLTSSQRRKRWRERNRSLSKERSVILPTSANDILLKLSGQSDLSPSAILLAGLYGVAALDIEHLRELATQAAAHYGRSLPGKPPQVDGPTSGDGKGNPQ